MTSSSAYQASGFNNHFDNSIRKFDDYVSTVEDIIRRARIDINASKEKHIIDAIGPKAFYPTDKTSHPRGILLIHGLLDSCAIMSSLYEHYTHKGFVVKTLLLPGHGTRAGDLLHVLWQDWADCCQFAINSFKKEVRELTVVALSTGASLATHLALEKAPIDKLVLFAPAFQLQARATSLIHFFHKIQQTLPFIHKKWIIKKEENDIGKYRSIAINGVYQLLKLIGKTTPRLFKEKLKQPIFMILSADDETISNDKAIACFKQQTHPHNQLLLYSNEDSSFTEENMFTVPSCIPEKRILNFSHICLPVSPKHALYGEAIAENNEAYKGALTPNNLLNYQVNRLTYNPCFTSMMEKIDLFLDSPNQIASP